MHILHKTLIILKANKIRNIYNRQIKSFLKLKKKKRKKRSRKGERHIFFKKFIFLLQSNIPKKL